jgi:CRISPR/Cas system CMR subunit Cmr4 (Cas7 group RAMP superfamily)
MAETPLHVGSGEEGEIADAGIARDHDERGVLWGTSLAGAIKEIGRLESINSSVPGGLEYLFGQDRGTQEVTAAACEGHLWVYDAPVETDGAFVQARTALDPETGSVVQGKLFSEENALAESSYCVRLDLDLEDPNVPAATAAKELLRRILEHLQDGSVRVGGKSSIGRGRVKLAELAVEKLNWADVWGNGKETWEKVSEWQQELKSADQASGGSPRILRVVFEAQVTFPTPLMVQETAPVEVIVDHAPECPLPRGEVPNACNELAQSKARYYDGMSYRYRLAEEESRYLPGSSIRGALRQRLLEQVRTRFPDQPAIAWDVSQEGNPQNGHPPKADDVPDEKISRCSPGPHVCLVSRLFGYAALGGTIFVEDMPVGGLPQKGLTHVAVDRVTRAPGDGKLFANLVIWPDENGVATLRIELLSPSKYDIGVAVLLLKDIYRGHVRIGHGKSIGQGRLGLKECKVTVYADAACHLVPGPASDGTVGSFQKRSRTFIAPTDPVTLPSWVDPQDEWFAFLNQCAAKVAAETEKWAAAAPKEGSTHGG